MLGGRDPVAIDAGLMKLLSPFEPKLADKMPRDVPHVDWAVRLGLGNSR